MHTAELARLSIDQEDTRSVGSLARRLLGRPGTGPGEARHAAWRSRQAPSCIRATVHHGCTMTSDSARHDPGGPGQASR